MKKELFYLSTYRIFHRIGCTIIALFLLFGNIAAQQQTATRNDDFLNIIGVGGHVASNITVYLNAPGVAADIQYMGARKYREALDANQQWQITVLQALAKKGVKLIAIPPNSGQSTVSYTLVISDLLKVAKTWNSLTTNALFAIEGPNEPIMFPITYGGLQGGGPNGSFIPVANFQRDWYAAIKADPMLKNIPVWGISLPGGENENVGLQFLTIPSLTDAIFPSGTIYADGLNSHVYTVFNGSAATIAGINYFDLQLTSDFVRTYRNRYSGYTLTQTKTMPKAITEFGYHTGGGPGPAVDLATQAKNITTGLFNAFDQGYSVVCIYDLYDIGDGFGIFSKTGTPRTTATYLHNLTTIMADPGVNAASFSPENLNFSLSNMPSTARYKLFQKSNGHFQLVIWNNVINYNLNTHLPITINPVNVTLTLNNTKADMQLFNPTVGALATNSSFDTISITAKLVDYPLIIDIQTTSTTSTTNRDRIVNQEIEIYPNPINSCFNVIIPPETSIKEASIKIYDLLGKERKNIPIKGHITTIDRSEIKSGIYLYHIVNNEKQTIGKLIVNPIN